MVSAYCSDCKRVVQGYSDVEFNLIAKFYHCPVCFRHVSTLTVVAKSVCLCCNPVRAVAETIIKTVAPILLILPFL